MWVLGSALVLGCAGAQAVEPLPQAVRGYNDAVRWQRFTAAAAHLDPARRDDFLDARDQLHEDLRINDFEVIRVRLDRDGVRARVHIKTTWHLDSEGIVRDTHTVQTWHRAGKQWLLIRETHLRGEPMPGVEKPADASPESREDAADIGSDDGQVPHPGDE